jgi:outer membrane protein assembly factor BamB
LWKFEPKVKINSIEPWPPAGEPLATAPVAVGPLVFISGPDGIVLALDADSGKLRWKAYTGGPVRFPPTIWKGRALVGSGDGWVYAFEAQTGRMLWRFRTAPEERKIPVYGALVSTWPAASGVVVEDGIAYVAAGIVNYDGTYVYALDAATGRIKWQNNSSGHLNAQARCGVGVQGHLLLHDGRLYLAGGNAVSPAIYDTKDGKCLNDPNLVQTLTQNNVLLSQSPRGWELSLLGNQVVACGKPFYAHPKYDVYDPTVFNRVFLASSAGLISAKARAVAGRDIVWVSNQNSKQVLCFDHIDRNLLSQSIANPQNQFLLNWAKLGVKEEPLWSYQCDQSVAIAVCGNAVVVAEKAKIAALNLENGSLLWSHDLPSPSVSWGIAVNRNGRVVVALEDGSVLCFGRLLRAQSSRDGDQF